MSSLIDDIKCLKIKLEETLINSNWYINQAKRQDCQQRVDYHNGEKYALEKSIQCLEEILHKNTEKPKPTQAPKPKLKEEAKPNANPPSNPFGDMFGDLFGDLFGDKGFADEYSKIVRRPSEKLSLEDKLKEIKDLQKKLWERK